MTSVTELIGQTLSARTSRARWKRLAALHRLGTREVFGAAVRLIAGRSAAERELGVEILGQLGYNDSYPFAPASKPVLRRVFRAERNTDVISAALRAAGNLQLWDLIEEVTPVGRRTRSPEVRLALAQALSLPFDPFPTSLVRLMIELTRDPFGEVRNWACFALGTQLAADSDDIRDALASRVRDRHLECRAEAILGLAKRRDTRALVPCLTALNRPRVGLDTVAAAAYLGRPELLPALRRLKRSAWDADRDLLTIAIELCDMAKQRNADRATRARFGRFKRLVEAQVAESSPRLRLRWIRLVVDRDDYFRPSELQIGWHKSRTKHERSWHWPGLLERGGGRVSVAARLAVADLQSAS